MPNTTEHVETQNFSAGSPANRSWRRPIRPNARPHVLSLRRSLDRPVRDRSGWWSRPLLQ